MAARTDGVISSGCIDPVNRTATTIGTAYEDTEHAWFGGVLAQNGKVYAFPFNGSQMSCINPKTNCTSLIELGLGLALDLGREKYFAPTGTRRV